MERANILNRVNCDFISKLPDPILHHILGLLNTKEAVQTCMLSKRWEHLWTSLPSLNINFEPKTLLDSDDKIVSGRFVNFVNTLLQRREPLDLDVFRLSCEDMICSVHVGHERDWIRYAIEHNARVLHLSLSEPVPPCIYTSTSLEELYLNDNHAYNWYLHNRDIDSSVLIVNLPNLRKLTIYESPLHSNYMKNLLSGCTILEFLWLDRCFLIDCVIAHKCLKHLAIVNCDIYETQLVISAPNLKHLAIVNCDFYETQLVISAPNLLSFLYDDHFLTPTNATLNMPSLSSSCLMSRDYSMMECLEGMTTFLNFLTNVELLELHFRCQWLQELSAVVLPLELPKFSKLENLTVAFCMFSCFQMVNCVLKNSSNLKKLIMLQEGCSCGEKGANTNESTNVSSTIVVSPCKKLEIVEVKYWIYNKMVQRLLDTLMDGTKEFKNLKIHLSKYESSKQYLIRGRLSF